MVSTVQSTELLSALRKLDGRSESVYNDSLDTRVTNYVAFLGFTILVWDHIITFDDEVRFIWRARKSTLVYLFFLNRYFTPLNFLGGPVAYFSDWSAKDRSRFVRYEGATVAIAVWVSGLIMLIRIRALYADRPKIPLLVGMVLLIEAGVFAWLLTRGEAVQHTSAVHACTMVFDPHLNFVPSLFAWVPLVYGTIGILLTLYRCAGLVKERTASRIVRTLLRDGLLYYSVIFAVNLLLAVMIVSTPPGIRNIAAQLEQLLTVAMISRITLSLRRKAVLVEDPSSDVDEDSYLFPRSTKTSPFHANHANHPSDKASQHWIEHAAVGLSRTYDSGASSGWRCSTSILRDSFDSDAIAHPETPPVFSTRDDGDSNLPRSCSRDVRSRDTSALELGVLPEPERVVLSDRDAYELCTLRASPYIRQ